MSAEPELVSRHVATLLAATDEAGVPRDLVGRFLVQEAIEIWKAQRDWQDIARELSFIADNLDPDTDHEFMRP